MPKFNKSEREYVKDIVNLYSLKRFSTEEIIEGIYEVTKRKVTPVYISQVKKRIKKEAGKWYQTIRDGEYEYIYQFKERIDEILWLQRKHYEIISSSQSASAQQASLAELHKLNITLSNYYDVAPAIVGGKNKSQQKVLDSDSGIRDQDGYEIEVVGEKKYTIKQFEGRVLDVPNDILAPPWAKCSEPECMKWFEAEELLRWHERNTHSPGGTPVSN